MTKKLKSRDHCVMGDGSFRCTRCGAEHKLDYPLDVWVLNALAEGFIKEHARCAVDPAAVAARMRYTTPEEWSASWDTGTSSWAIFGVMTGQKTTDTFSPPLDPGDFGRCYRLLRAFPTWRARLGEVAARFPAWAWLVACWDELTALYERDLPTGKSAELARRMDECRTAGAAWRLAPAHE